MRHQRAAALAAADEAPWRSLLPPSVVVRRGAGEVFVMSRTAATSRSRLTLEDGSRRSIPIPDQQPESRTIDGCSRVACARAACRTTCRSGGTRCTAGEHRVRDPRAARHEASLIVTPDRRLAAADASRGQATAHGA